MAANSISHYKAGLIASVMLMVSFLTYYYQGITFQETWLNWVPFVLYILLIAGFVIAYGKQEGITKFEPLFTYGFKATAITVILYTIFIVIVLYAIPEYKAKHLAIILESVKTQENLSGLEKEQAEEKLSSMISVMHIGGALFRNTMSGAFGALLGALTTIITSKISARNA